MPGPLVVVDTEVVARALIGVEGSSSYRLVNVIETGAFRLALSDEFLRELSDVVSYPQAAVRITSAVRAFRMALDVGVEGEMHYPRRLDWPNVLNPGDWWMPDLAYASEADYIASCDPHLAGADLPLSVEVVEPPTLLRKLDVCCEVR